MNAREVNFCAMFSSGFIYLLNFVEFYFFSRQLSSQTSTWMIHWHINFNSIASAEILSFDMLEAALPEETESPLTAAYLIYIVQTLRWSHFAQ